MRIRPAHVRRAGFCVAGVRRWARRHGVDWRKFLREGIPAGDLAHIEDPVVSHVVKIAEEDAENGP